MPTCSALRYAHSEGLTSVCYDEAGKYILTCGSDGDVRIWEGAEDDDAVSHRTGDRAFCVLFKNEKFYVATDTNTVQAFTFPDGSVDGIMARFTAPVNHMCLDESGNTLVAGSSDFSVKSVNLATSDVTKFEGHEAPILGVALDPKKEYLASSSCDGSVKIWKMENQECVKSIQGLPKVSDTSLAKGWCRLCWEQNHGKHLYIPMEKEIQIYDRDTWSKSGVLQDDEYTGIYSVLEMSPNGNFIAAGCYDGHVLIFNLKNGACTDRFKHENGLSIMSMAWNPKNQEEIAFCDREGQLGLLSNIKLDGQPKTGTEVRVKETMGIFDDDDDTDLVLAGGDEPPEGNEDSNDSVPSNNVLKTFEDDADSVDLDVPPIVPPVIQREGYKPTPPQPAFQPGSSPVHLSSRYMMWNAVGIIKQFNTDEEESIDIEFHNTSVHHAMHLTNSAGYTMADISTEAVVLASPSDPENPSKLTCMHFGSWDNSKEWTIPMPEEEDIEAVSLGEDWIAVATSCRVVRIFSLGGIQKEIFSIPGPVVCLCAHTNQLMITYHRGMGLPGDQCLGVHLLVVEGETQINHQPLPLSSKTTLSWMGFSAEGTPFYMDSRGILRMCNRKFGKNWMQVADTKSHTKGKSDHFWIVSVHENPQQLRCIPCKGSRYPATLPRPAVGVLPFQIPLCQMNTEKSQYEEVFLRTQLFGNHLDHWSEIGYEFDPSLPSELFKPAQESLMKLFALSARCEREFRALEVCEIMKDPHTLQLAIKYACRMKYLQLAERISEVAQRKSNEEEERILSQQQEESQYTQSYNGQEDDEDMEEDQENVETPTATGPLLNLKPKQKTEMMSQSFGSSGRSNPFKVITPQKADSTKGTQVFDHMSKKKQTSPAQVTIKNTRPIKTKKTTQGQVKLPVKQKNEEVINGHDDKNVNRVKSAFDLWFEEAKTELQEEFPDTEDDVLTQTAAERFRQIPKADRQIWTQKAKQLKENTESKKRKREDESDECQTKKTNPKLAAFSFTKA